jgi:chromate transporter
MTSIANPAREQELAPAPTNLQLFLGFLHLGLIGFGGVLPLAHRMVVEQRRWLTGSQFTELLGLCQFLPGGNIVNMSVAIGLKFRGATGALAAILGLLAVPSAVVIGLGILYDHFHDEGPIRHLFPGLAAAAAGLLVSMAVKLALPLRSKPVAIAIAAICFVAIAILRVPLLPTLLVLAPVSMLAVWKVGP